MKKERKIIIAITYKELEAPEEYESTGYLADADKYGNESMGNEDDVDYKGIELTPVEEKQHAYLFNEDELKEILKICDLLDKYGRYNPYYVESYYTYV